MAGNDDHGPDRQRKGDAGRTRCLAPSQPSPVGRADGPFPPGVAWSFTWVGSDERAERSGTLTLWVVHRWHGIHATWKGSDSKVGGSSYVRLRRKGLSQFARDDAFTMTGFDGAPMISRSCIRASGKPRAGAPASGEQPRLA